MARAPAKSARTARPAPKAKAKTAAPRVAKKIANDSFDMSTRFYDTLISFPDPRQETEAERRSALSLIQHIADRFQQNAVSAAAVHGLNVTENYVLVILSRSGPDCIAPVAELQRRLGFTSGGVTRCLDRMVASGLVVRVSDPHDGRAWMAQLTRKGRTLATRLNEEAPRLREMHAELSREEWQTLESLLARISNTMPRL